MSQTVPLCLTLLAGLCFAVLGLSYKLASARDCRAMPFAAVFLTVAALLAGARAAAEPTTWADPRLWCLGGIMGLVLYGSLGLVVVVNRLGPASVSWTLINLSLVVPILAAPVVFGERFVPLDGLLLVVFCLMLAALRQGTREAPGTTDAPSAAFWPVLMVVFMANGGFQLCTKLKDTLFGQTNSPGLAAVYFGCGMVLALVTHAARTRGLRFTRDELLIGALAGGCSGLGNLLLLNAMSLPAIVVFPLAQGISLVGGVGLTAVLYRERLTAGKLVGFGLSLVALLVAVLR